MRTRSAAALALALALVACKSEKKTEDKKVDEPKVVSIDAAAAVTKPEAAPDAAPAPVGDTLEHPFFYAVTKDGKTSHLLGSIHLGIDAKRQPKVVWDAANSAKTFAMEADISNALALAKAVMRTDGGSLAKDLGPDYFKKLDDAIGTAIPGGLKMIDGMKPIVALGQLEALGMPATEPLDLTFLKVAQDRKIEVVYLEEAALQLAILEKWFDVDSIKYQLDHLDKIKEAHEKMLASYISGDEASMQLADTASKDDWIEEGRKPEDFDKMVAELLYDRNKSWIPKIEEMAAAGDAFVVVGAAHLVGDGSVVDLLRKDGYTVERVSP